MAQALRIPSFWGVREDEEVECSPRQWSPVRRLLTHPWLREVYDRLAEVSRLPENWDSYGASRVKSKALERARLLLSNIDLDDLPKPQVSPTAVGGVGLHWRVGLRDLELDIDVDGEVRFLKTYLQQLDAMEDGIVSQPEDVQQVLNWLME